MNLDNILTEIQRKGQANREAIKTHHDVQAGLRGTSGNHGHKNEARGCVGIRHKRVRVMETPRLPVITIHHGEPMKANGSDGYQRDRITAVIKRISPRSVESKRAEREFNRFAKGIKPKKH